MNVPTDAAALDAALARYHNEPIFNSLTLQLRSMLASKLVTEADVREALDFAATLQHFDQPTPLPPAPPPPRGDS
jgi:hypothetical protein